MNDRPDYDRYSQETESRSSLAAEFASQILSTTADKLDRPVGTLDVLDAGSGYGATALELSRLCASVVACEPARALHAAAEVSKRNGDYPNVRLLNATIEDLAFREAFDLIVLDNVYEHLPDQHAAMLALTRALRPGGVIFLLVPNKLWPIEAHYRLPFLAWLPIKWADRYLRLTRRGRSYQDASYAPTYSTLNAELDRHGLDYEYTLPGNPAATMSGAAWHYRVGMSLLRRYPDLWRISKALLVVAKKPVEDRDALGEQKRV